MTLDYNFYTKLENTFRGSEEEIKRRLGVYIPVLKLYAKDRQPTALDIGCGRGEMLSIYTELGFEVFGIDINKVVLEQTRAKGFNVAYADALDFLKNQKPESYDAISLIQVIEHIPFEYTVELFQEVFRALRKGGVFIVETPNTMNPYVGLYSFWIDPTHIKPINPELMKVLGEYTGFYYSEFFGINANKSSEYQLTDLYSFKTSPDIAMIFIKETEDLNLLYELINSIKAIKSREEVTVLELLNKIDLAQKTYINDKFEFLLAHINELQSKVNYMDFHLSMVIHSKPWFLYNKLSDIKRFILSKENHQKIKVYYKRFLVSVLRKAYENKEIRKLAGYILARFPELGKKIKVFYFSTINGQDIELKYPHLNYQAKVIYKRLKKRMEQ